MSKELIDAIDRGKAGLNKGLPHGFPRLMKYLPGIQQGTSYLIGAESGVGKSAFADNTFVFNPIDWYLSHKHETDVKLKIIYYSFEVPKRDMYIKAVCRYIYRNYGVLLDLNYVLSRGENRISQEHYDLVTKSMDFLDEMNDILEVIDIQVNPTGIYKDLMKYAYSTAKSGVVPYQDAYSFQGDFVPKNPNLYTEVVIDHAALVLKERSYGTKEAIDKLSEYLVYLRNKSGITPVVTQQLNRALSSTDRIKLDRLEPQLSDFKDTGNTIQDSHVVLTLFSPNRYELDKFRGYDTFKLKDRFRSLSILKNRDGEADKLVPLSFIGECGLFEEMPLVSDMTEAKYEYYKSIKKNYA